MSLMTLHQHANVRCSQVVGLVLQVARTKDESGVPVEMIKLRNTNILRGPHAISLLLQCYFNCHIYYLRCKYRVCQHVLMMKKMKKNDIRHNKHRNIVTSFAMDPLRNHLFRVETRPSHRVEPKSVRSFAATALALQTKYKDNPSKGNCHHLKQAKCSQQLPQKKSSTSHVNLTLISNYSKRNMGIDFHHVDQVLLTSIFISCLDSSFHPSVASFNFFKTGIPNIPSIARAMADA